MITIEVENRSGAEVDEPGAVELAGRVRMIRATSRSCSAATAHAIAR